MEYLSGKVTYEDNGIYINVFNPNSWECANIVTGEIAVPRENARNSQYKGFYAVCGDEKIPCALKHLTQEQEISGAQI